MEKALKRIIVNKKQLQKGEHITNIILLFIGIYFSYIFWYLIENSNFLKVIKLDMIILEGFLIIMMSLIYSIIRYTNILFFNHNIYDIMTYPIKSKSILKIALKYCTKLQLAIAVIIYLPVFIINNNNIYILINLFVFNILCIFIVNFFVLSLILVLGKVISTRLVGYFFILLQYIVKFGSPIILVIGLLNKKVLYSLNIIFEMLFTESIRLYVIGFIVLVFICSITVKMYSGIYREVYYKVQSFKLRNKLNSQNKYINIQNLYVFIEIKQVLRNKELLFNAMIKSVVISILLTKIFLGKLSPWDARLSIYVWVVITGIIASMNCISVTTYSRDSTDIEIYKLLPIDLKKVFQSKVLVSFFINQILILLYVIYEIINQATYVFHLTIYATSINYICSWIGVFLDYNNPVYKSSTSELISGNFTRIFVMIFTLVKIVVDLKLIDYIGISLVNCINLIIISIMLIYTFKFIERGNHDRS